MTRAARSSLSLQAPLSEMEIVAWSSFTDEELIERLTDQVWRADDLNVNVGVSLTKVNRYISKFVFGRSRYEKRRLAEKIHSAASGLLYAQIQTWISEVRAVRNWHCATKYDLKTYLLTEVSCGARKEVFDAIGTSLHWK